MKKEIKQMRKAARSLGRQAVYNVDRENDLDMNENFAMTKSQRGLNAMARRSQRHEENKLLARFDKQFDKYVPASGTAKTVGGEHLRAISRVAYRYNNDGDIYSKHPDDYGSETVKPSVDYLEGSSNPNIRMHATALKVAAKEGGTKFPNVWYEKAINNMIKAGIKFVKKDPAAKKQNYKDSR